MGTANVSLPTIQQSRLLSFTRMPVGRNLCVGETLTMPPPQQTWCLWHLQIMSLCQHCLVGSAVKASALRTEDLGFKSCLRRDFSGSSQTTNSKIGTPVAILPGTWHYRVSAGAGQPSVSTLWLGEVESLISGFYLSVAARKIVWADPSLRYTSMLLGH